MSAGLSGPSVWRPQSRYTVSRIECRIKFPQNQRCRAKIALHPPKSRCRTFLWIPPVALSCLTRSRQGGPRVGVVAAGWWRVSRHFWVPKTDRATRGVETTVTPVALHCATEPLPPVPDLLKTHRLFSVLRTDCWAIFAKGVRQRDDQIRRSKKKLSKSVAMDSNISRQTQRLGHFEGNAEECTEQGVLSKNTFWTATSPQLRPSWI